MLTVALCPVCGQGIDLGSAGEQCPHCGASLPEQLRSAAQVALQRQRPVLITVLMYFFFLCSIAWLGALAVAAVGSSSFYKIDGEQVPRGQLFLRAGLPLFVGGSLMLAAAYAFWKERPWGRHLVFLCLVLPVFLFWAFSTFPVISCFDLAMPIVFVAFLLGYFYAKPNVARYYRQLRGLPRAEP